MLRGGTAARVYQTTLRPVLLPVKPSPGRAAVVGQGRPHGGMAAARRATPCVHVDTAKGALPPLGPHRAGNAGCEGLGAIRRSPLPLDLIPPPPGHRREGCCCGTRSAARRDGYSSPSHPLRTSGHGEGSAASAGAPLHRKRRVRGPRSHPAVAPLPLDLNPPPPQAIAGEGCCCGTRSAARRGGYSSPSHPLRTSGHGEGSAASAGAPLHRKRRVRGPRSHPALAPLPLDLTLPLPRAQTP